MSAQATVPSCTESMIDALYQLRIESESYSACATNSRSSSDLFDYKLYSERASALRTLIQEYISQIDIDACADNIEIHIHNSTWYYCVTIRGRSFHVLYSLIDYNSVDELPRKSVDTITHTSTKSTNYTEKEATQFISDKYRSPNKFLSNPFVTACGQSTFAGWKHLDDSISVSDKVTETHREVYDLPSIEETQYSFRLDVGDEFVAKETDCVVTSKYQMWVEPAEDSVYVRPRKVYDISIGSDEFYGILEDTILVDWGIQIQTLHDPLPRVSTQFTSSLGLDSVEPEFDVGDVMYVNITDVRYVKYKLTKVVATLSGVYCYLHPVEDPSIDVPVGESPSQIILSIDELVERFIE